MADGFRKEQIRTAVIISIGFIFLFYILFKEKYFFEAKVYGAMGIFTILSLLVYKSLWKKSQSKESLDNAYLGVDKKWISGIFIGLASALGFIVLTQIKIFGSVAQLITPSIPLSLSASAIVVIFLAPIFEELSLTASLTSIFKLYMPFWLSAILKGVFFSAIHYYAYVIVAHTTLQYALGAFIGAGMFGIMSAYLAKYFGIEASIAGHFGFNFYNFNSVFKLLTVTG